MASERCLSIEYTEPIDTAMESVLEAVAGVFGWKLRMAFVSYEQGRVLYFEQEANGD